MREKYETLKLGDLREIAKKRGIKGASGMKKSEIIDLMCELDEKEKEAAKAAPAKKAEKTETEPPKEKAPQHKKKVVVTTSKASVP